MTEQFINDLVTSPYYERILNGHDVVMIFLTGSRLIDITDGRSDFDLMVLTNDNEREEYVSEFLTYYTKKVHWHYVPVTKLIANEDGNLLTCNGEVIRYVCTSTSIKAKVSTSILVGTFLSV